MADIENEATLPAEFEFKSAIELRLLEQIVAHIAGLETRAIDRKSGNPDIPANKINFNLTKAQGTDVNTLYSVYRKALNKEVDSLFVAFVYKNNIFSEKPGIDAQGWTKRAAKVPKSDHHEQQPQVSYSIQCAQSRVHC